MFFLVALLFGILYGVVTGIGIWTGAGNVYFYIILAFAFIGIQYLVGPSIVAWTMKVKWVSEKESPELHRMVAELAREAGFPKPKWVSLTARDTQRLRFRPHAAGRANLCYPGAPETAG
jgi:heat shock protein HtpX